MITIESKIPLPQEGEIRFLGITYDGCWFYFTVCNEKKIIRFDNCICHKECFNTERCYTYLCYDLKENCFWALECENPMKVFKLNKCMEEIGYIKIPKHFDGIPTGISNNCCDTILSISFSSGILCMDKYNPAVYEIIWEKCKEEIISFVSVCPYYICQYVKEKQLSIRILSHDRKYFKEFDTPFRTGIQAAVFFPEDRDSLRCHLMVLVNDGESCIYHCVMDCSELYGHISDCNYLICNTNCFNARHCNCEKTICDILESIALVETSIAHILNAEGEKLQKVTGCSNNICEILEVNCAVNKTIASVTRLEMTLVEKLEKVIECRNCYLQCDSIK